MVTQRRPLCFRSRYLRMRSAAGEIGGGLALPVIGLPTGRAAGVAKRFVPSVPLIMPSAGQKNIPSGRNKGDKSLLHPESCPAAPQSARTSPVLARQTAHPHGRAPGEQPHPACLTDEQLDTVYRAVQP